MESPRSSYKRRSGAEQPRSNSVRSRHAVLNIERGSAEFSRWVGILFFVPAIFGGIFACHDHLDALNPSLLGSIVIVE